MNPQLPIHRLWLAAASLARKEHCTAGAYLGLCLNGVPLAYLSIDWLIDWLIG